MLFGLPPRGLFGGQTRRGCLGDDLSLPGGGLSLVPELREALPEMAILVLSMHDHEPWISEALHRGVAGYVTKGAASEELVAGLLAVAGGQS